MPWALSHQRLCLLLALIASLKALYQGIAMTMVAAPLRVITAMTKKKVHLYTATMTVRNAAKRVYFRPLLPTCSCFPLLPFFLRALVSPLCGTSLAFLPIS